MIDTNADLLSPRRRVTVALTLVLALLLTLLLQVTGPRPAAADGTDPSGRFVGSDGQTYDEAPAAVEGANGTLFLGNDFDGACYLGPEVKEGFRKLARLARIIRASGREVVFTVAPNKSVVSPDVTVLPHGRCDRQGLHAATRALDEFAEPDYLPLRQPLVDDPRQVYWKTDLHWTTVGGSVFSHSVAKRLDPQLARRQRYTSTTKTVYGSLNQLRGVLAYETAEAIEPATRVRVTTDPGSPVWHGLPEVLFEHAWNTRPARRTYPGHTLLIGDSFTLYALNTLRPLFRHGRFLWAGHVPVRDLVAGIKHSDTVVIEVLQLFLQSHLLGKKTFQNKVSRALR